MAIEPAPETSATSSSNGTLTEEEQALAEEVVGSMLLSIIDLPQRFKGLKIDHDQWRPQPGEPGEEDHMPIPQFSL